LKKLVYTHIYFISTSEMARSLSYHSGSQFPSLNVKSIDGSLHTLAQLRRERSTMLVVHHYQESIDYKKLMLEMTEFNMEIFWLFFCLPCSDRDFERYARTSHWDPNTHFMLIEGQRNIPVLKRGPVVGSTPRTGIWLLDSAGKVIFNNFPRCIWFMVLAMRSSRQLVALQRQHTDVTRNRNVLENQLAASDEKLQDVTRKNIILARENTSLQNDLTLKDKQLEDATQSINGLEDQKTTLLEELDEVTEMNATLTKEKEAIMKKLGVQIINLNEVLRIFNQEIRRRGRFNFWRCADKVDSVTGALATISSLAESLNIDL